MAIFGTGCDISVQGLGFWDRDCSVDCYGSLKLLKPYVNLKTEIFLGQVSSHCQELLKPASLYADPEGANLSLCAGLGPHSPVLKDSTPECSRWCFFPIVKTTPMFLIKARYPDSMQNALVWQIMFG